MNTNFSDRISQVFDVTPMVWHDACLYVNVSVRRAIKMNKKIAIALILSSMFGLYAESAEDTVEEIFNKNRPSDLASIAGNLSAVGSLHQSKGDYASALTHYSKSLKIREELGLEKTQGYALVLFLSSIAEYRLGNSCKAVGIAKKVISIYQYLGQTEDAKLAEVQGLSSYKEACSLVTGNL